MPGGLDLATDHVPFAGLAGFWPGNGAAAMLAAGLTSLILMLIVQVHSYLATVNAGLTVFSLPEPRPDYDP
jgi:hypothetical protein